MREHHVGSLVIVVDRLSERERGVLVVLLLRINPLTSSDLVSYAAGLAGVTVGFERGHPFISGQDFQLGHLKQQFDRRRYRPEAVAPDLDGGRQGVGIGDTTSRRD